MDYSDDGGSESELLGPVEESGHEQEHQQSEQEQYPPPSLPITESDSNRAAGY